MTTQRFFDSVHFLTYARLLRQLHKLISEDVDETPEGEILRDKMDEPAHYLNQDEIDCLNGISADFYALTGSGRSVPAISANAREMESAIVALYERRFPTSLDLIRKNEANLPPASVAYFRGRIWSQAGESEIGLEFFQRAKDLEPQNGGYAYMWLETLAAVNSDKALSHAEILLQHLDSHPPQLILGAASIVFESIDRRPGDEASGVLHRLIPIFENVIMRLEMSGEEKSISVMASAMGLLSRCYERLDNAVKAREWLDRGLIRFPTNLGLLTARGIHLYGSDADNSVNDFMRAIQLGITEALPYFFMAHFYLTRNQYDRCLEMASRALQLSDSQTITSDCLEWIAISQANMGFPSDTVVAAFRAAQNYAPDNQRIARNLTIFADSLVASSTEAMPGVHPGISVVWELPDARIVQSIGSQELRLAA